MVGVIPDIPDGCDAGIEQQLGRLQPAKSPIGAVFVEITPLEVPILLPRSQVSMRVHQSRHHPKSREVHYFSIVGDFDVRADCVNFFACNEDNLIFGDSTFRRVNQVASTNSYRLSVHRTRKPRKQSTAPAVLA